MLASARDVLFWKRKKEGGTIKGGSEERKVGKERVEVEVNGREDNIKGDASWSYERKKTR